MTSFQCEWCDKPFKYPSQLKEHIRVHTREKPYPCSFCTKAFSHSSALTQHERIHTGDKPFQCQHCDKAFSQSSNLKRHERVHKSQRVSAPSPPPPQRRPSLKENEIRWRPPAAAVAESNTAAAAPSMSAMIAAALKQQAAYADRIHSALVGSSSPSRPRDHMHTSHQGRAIAGPSAPARNVASTMMSAVSSPRDSPRSFKVYTMSSPLRPLNEKCAQAMKVKLEVAGGATSSPSRPQRCSGGEDTFYNSDTHQLHHASSGRTNAISDSIEHYFDLNGPSLSPLMADEVFPMFILSPSLGLGSGSPGGGGGRGVSSPLTHMGLSDNHEGLHFR